LFNYIDNFKEENKTKAKDLKRVCELNKAACYIKLKDFSEARTACNAVLKEEKDNVKALFRRATAEFGLKNFIECIADCKKIVEVDKKNKEARDLLKQAQAGQKEVDKQAKGLFANMCKALGKGPIPEPAKAKQPDGDDMDEDDDEEMPPASGESEKKEEATENAEGSVGNTEATVASAA